MNDVVAKVETTLYNRMLKNAFVGFFKSAGVALLIGAVIGALVFGAGILPATLLPAALMAEGAGATLAGAATVAALLAVPAGAFGAVAGIQSTRDARRYFNADEASRDSLIPARTDDLKPLVEPLLDERMAKDTDYRERLAKRRYDPTARSAP